MMMENNRCGELMIENHWMDKLLKEVLMIDELSIVETDKVNHTMEMDMLKLVVKVECFGKCVDEFDMVTMLFGEMQLKQEDQSYVHASNEIHLHVVHVVPSDWKDLENDINCFDVTISLNGFCRGELNIFLKSCYTIHSDGWPDEWTFLNGSKDHSTLRSIHHIKFHSAFP
ncbi:hypothetical protein Tco_1483054 [Tanacetum coccineum]